MGWPRYLLLPWVLGLLSISVLPGQSSSEYEISGHHGQGCPPNDFECLTGECLASNSRCDGEIHCRDGSDEENCDFVLCKEPAWFKCQSGRCISTSFVCDGDNDCDDFSDEKNCPPLINMDHHDRCTDSEFRCSGDGVCIPINWSCDGHPDCIDGSDEIIGCTGKKVCNGGFLCNNTHHCIPMEFHCDGENDCKDGFDEQNCPNKMESHILEECTLENHKFHCKDKSMCITLHQLCDHIPDCLDKSDEGGMCSNISQCDSSKCSHECVHTPTGPTCVCPLGSYINGTNCVDIDECMIYGKCDQICYNVQNSYRCSCEQGYKLRSDGRSCKVEEGEGLLLFSSVNQIRGFKLSSEFYFQVIDHLTQVIGVAYDGHYVYWTNIFEGEEAIGRSLKDGSERLILVNSGLGSPEDLAIDMITRNIYFTDPKMSHIGVCSHDGSACTVLHNKDIDKPRSIALQSNDGLMYWSDWGQRPLIARSGMDGSEVTDFVNTNIHWPNGITIDHGNSRLYWVDAKLLLIESIKLDGSDRRVVNSEGIKHPFSIAVFEDSLYWSDFEGMEVQACNKFTGKNMRSIVRETKDRIFGIHIFHEAVRRSLVIENPCLASGCSDMCLMAPVSRPLRYTCACPDTKTLTTNRHFCTTSNNVEFIMAGIGKTLIQIEPKHLGKQNINEINLPDVQEIGALAYDSLTGNVIISDSSSKSFFSVNLSSAHTTLLLSGDLGKVEGMDVDPLGHNLYWVDSDRLTVELMSLNSLERTVLKRDLGGDTPVDIALAPKQGYMFIALSGPSGTHIDRFYMNGLARMHLVDDKLIGPGIGLTYDHTSNQLFWTDSGSGLIERADVDGVERHTFQEMYGTPTSVTTLSSDVFWTSHGSPSIEFANKFQEEPAIKRTILNLEMGWETLKIVAITDRVGSEGHNCQNHNGGCSHFCLVIPHASVCGCPNGMHLQVDGRTCEKPILCRESEFHCKTGECISDSLRCNHRNDCPEGDDELHCAHYAIECPRGKFSCHNGEKCLDDYTKCDGHSDCWDRSDEMNCHLHNTSCPQGKFECGSGGCIDFRKKCDTLPDCEDGSDEMDCQKSTCPENNFRCNDGSCLPSTWECDGEQDCIDGSDEHSNCVIKVTCSSKEFSCGNGRCVEISLVCDGYDDCEDFSDESACSSLNSKEEDEYHQLDIDVQVASHVDDSNPIVHKCKLETEFKCTSQPGVCLPIAVRCNGTSECLRGEDEENCNNCFNHEFECMDTKRCILREWICDHNKDCGDGSDEDPEMCDFHNKSAPAKHSTGTVVQCSNFACKDGQQCLPYNKVCNGHPDCNDGSDEGGRCGHSCMNSGCQEICQETPYGPHCECSSGFQLMGDARTCSDIDECKLGTYCTQYCSNTPGSFSCSCKYPDYVLREDRMSCKAKGSKMQYIYALGNQIRYITQSHSLVGVIYNNRGTELRVSGLDVNARNKLVFWTSDLGGSLTKISLDSKGETEVIKNLVRPTRMSVDWVTENVYFIENYNEIKVCHFGIQKCALIVAAKPGVRIESLIVDPVMREMFWSEEASNSRGLLIDHHNPQGGIKRADLAGINPITIIDFDAQKITDIAVDSLHHVIYWLDAHHGKVERSTCNGTNRQTVFQSPDIPVELGLFEDNVYWLVEGKNPQRQRELEIYGNVWHCGISGPKIWRCDVIKIAPKNMLGHPYQFRIMHEALQPEERDPCKLVNCTHVCVLTQSGTACLCENGAHVHPGEICKSNITSKANFVKETQETDKPKPSISWWLLTIILLMFIILPTIAGAVYFTYNDIMRWCCRDKSNKFNFSSFHFHNNPTYHDAMSHRESSFHHDRLDPGQHQYENPMTGKLSESNIAIVSSNEMNSFPHPKKIEFHLADLQDDETSSVEYSDTLPDNHRVPLIQ